MKKYLILLLSALTCSTSYAQSNARVHKGGDWYVGASVGFSQSLAENAVKTDFITHQLPSVNVMLGHNFNPYVGLRLTGGLNAQTSRASKAAVSALPEIYGRYGFMCASGTLSGVFNITNLFMGYDNDRPMTFSALLGAGYIQTFGFSNKVKQWDKYYPVNGEGGGYATGHIGVQTAIKLSEPWDLDIECRVNATDNNYNGVSNGNHLDFYVDLMVNFRYHFKNKQGLRRFALPPREIFVDPVLRDFTGDYVETVRFGEQMVTTVPFYSGFSYVNTNQMKHITKVAEFLRANPEVCLAVVGHPDVIDDEDLEYNKNLAEARAKAVRDILVDKYHINADRLRLSFDDTILQPYKTVREWVPAVNFIMEQYANEEIGIDKY